MMLFWNFCISYYFLKTTLKIVILTMNNIQYFVIQSVYRYIQI